MGESDFDIHYVPRDEAAEHAAFRRLRENDPIHWDEHLPGWIITRHADLKAVARQPEIFSSEGHGPWIPFDSRFSLQAEDGPGHDRTRAVVSRGFTPRATAHLAGRIDHYADEAIDAVAADGRCDLVQAIAQPVPLRIIADLLGLEEHDLFLRWTEAVEHTLEGDASQAANDAASIRAFEQYVREIVERRTREPAGDLISTMVAGRAEGVFESFVRESFPGVPEGDGVVGFIAFLVMAGSETTRHAIANGLRLLMAHPEQMRRLQADPSLIGVATEEILRVTAPARAMQRTVTRDTTLGGREMRKGDRVVLVFGSANRDAEVFEAPDEFRIDRQPNDHVSLGFGSHYCLGASLARMEIAGVVNRILARLPDIAPDPASPPVRLRSVLLSGLVRLPVIFSPSVDQ